MKNIFYSERKNILFVIACYISVFIFIYLKILIINKNHFMYTLDDAYIFLALSKYKFLGITKGLYANPSSSLLGPYLLTSLVFIFGEQFPLYFNLLTSIISIFLFWKILFDFHDEIYSSPLIRVIFVVAFIVVTNQIYLVFSGMEHNLQILLCIILFYGLCYENKFKTVPTWFVFSIILCPLLRYDFLGIFIAILIYLYINRYVKIVNICIWSVFPFISVYFFAWHFLGQPYFPSSLIIKSDLIRHVLFDFHIIDVGPYVFLLFVFIFCFCLTVITIAMKSIISDSPRNFALIIILLFTLVPIFYRNSFHNLVLYNYESFFLIACLLQIILLRRFSFAELSSFVVFCVLFSGISFIENWDMNRFFTFRLVAYWYVFILLGLYFIFLNKDIVHNLSKSYFIKITRLSFFNFKCVYFGVIFFFLFLIMNRNYISVSDNIIASNSFYRMNYQVSRFIRDYYKNTTAVIDAGIVSYYNSYKIIDLCGLGNIDILKTILPNHNPWCVYNPTSVVNILKKENVHLVVIFSSLKPPPGYIFVSKISLSQPSIIPYPEISFYSTPEEFKVLYTNIKRFEGTLPSGSNIIQDEKT